LDKKKFGESISDACRVFCCLLLQASPEQQAAMEQFLRGDAQALTNFGREIEEPARFALRKDGEGSG